MPNTYATPAAVIVISILFPVLGIIVVSLRFYTRGRAKIRPWVDDWLTIPALLLEIALAGLLIWGAATHSLGDLLPPPNVPGPDGYLFSDSDQQIRLQQIQYFFDFIGVFAFGLLKLSILFFYRKIFCAMRTDPTFDVITKVLIVLVIAWTLAFGIGAIFLCGVHPKNAWAPVAVVAEKCSAQLTFLEAYAISDFVMDVIIWSLPHPKVSIDNPSEKLAITGVFFVGLLTIAASATRMAIYIKYIVNAFAQSDGETLITYLLFWTMIECGLGVIVVCLPTLRSLFGRWTLKITPGSLLSGIRNVLTLQSISSNSEQRGSHFYAKTDNPPYLLSNINSGRLEEGTVQTHIVGAGHDLEGRGSVGSGIGFKREVQQFESC
ncbi:Hypothetical protein PENO1_101630 [Penicillium occitanis (nom. inval.)]|nr:Hypothetical protein PENO1_101630 [Penicillium occitanis (nom. inval.)]PCG90390.1 hypothetical protein PENOC_102230 [Penicillium occitanis (nom. inval.)]